MYYRYWEMNGVKFRCKNPKEHIKTLEYKPNGEAWATLCEYITAKQRKTFMNAHIKHLLNTKA